MKRTYRDLIEFNLPLVGSDDPAFGSLARDIEDRPQPFASWSSGELDTAAILLNQSGKAIIVLAYIWRYTNVAGKTRVSRYSNLGSSKQMDILCGQAEVVPDLGSFILPGSYCLITERGMFGNNLDVLPADSAGRGGGYMGAGRVAGTHQEFIEETVEIELCLDVAIFEDGLCVGPDDSGLLESLTADLESRRGTAQEIAAALRKGASEGQIFEILRPLARRSSPSPRGIGEQGRISSPFLAMFANMAIHRLVNAPSLELLAWFEHLAEPCRTRLHRPS